MEEDYTLKKKIHSSLLYIWSASCFNMVTYYIEHQEKQEVHD